MKDERDVVELGRSISICTCISQPCINLHMYKKIFYTCMHVRLSSVIKLYLNIKDVNILQGVLQQEK